MTHSEDKTKTDIVVLEVACVDVIRKLAIERFV